MWLTRSSSSISCHFARGIREGGGENSLAIPETRDTGNEFTSMLRREFFGIFARVSRIVFILMLIKVNCAYFSNGVT